MPIDEVGELPWWAYRLAVEGLNWHRPWIHRTVDVDPDALPRESDVVDGDAGSLAALGFSVEAA